jgi:hypothetical protein
MTGLWEQQDHFGVGDLDTALLAEGCALLNCIGRCAAVLYQAFMGLGHPSIYARRRSSFLCMEAFSRKRYLWDLAPLSSRTSLRNVARVVKCAPLETEAQIRLASLNGTGFHLTTSVVCVKCVFRIRRQVFCFRERKQNACLVAFV